MSRCLDSVFRRKRLFRIIKAVEEIKNRILVVDHNKLLLEGICTLIRLQPDMELVGVAASASEAVRLFRQHRPDVVLMDLDLPASAAIRSIREIREVDSTGCILGLFTHPWDECAALALRAGARSCLTKDRLNRDLVTLIRECLR
jgi:DNA-binding NarL/FixJ family response regulator